MYSLIATLRCSTMVEREVDDAEAAVAEHSTISKSPSRVPSGSASRSPDVAGAGSTTIGGASDIVLDQICVSDMYSGPLRVNGLEGASVRNSQTDSCTLTAR